MAVGPLLRWKEDNPRRIRFEVLLVAAILIGVIGLVSFFGQFALLPLLGLGLAAALGVAAFLPLRGRSLTRVPVATWGMVMAHFGIAVSLFGMASEAAFTQERLAAVAPGGSDQVGDFTFTLENVTPVAGPNWTAIEARIAVSRDGGAPVILTPQARNFWSPPQSTSESALLTRWNGQLYAVIGNQAADGRWQIRMWWKPFVTFIWYGGLLIALGGVLAIIGRVRVDMKRRKAVSLGDERRADIEALGTAPVPAE
jgi:cytochrome c-type biogenesis protein CcmF